jgi:hypothetical protein
MLWDLVLPVHDAILEYFMSQAIKSLFLGGYEIKTSPLLEMRR